MKVFNVQAIEPRTTKTGAVVEAVFDLDVNGVVCRRLNLVKAQNGRDIIWSHRFADGPGIQITAETRDRITPMVREKLGQVSLRN